ncbi:hypothetical protein [Rhodopseudomonas pseudopalustris]|uniref:Uncharacterized protein n=1 Tax=Rhodopseudomonas pseudopalustris TaxID=1513892 RepID=A0A1H8XBI8_9BRAD|nr:hypothetical protein [Rhodopseudomonas pseudopalustris]SEP37334.1 hypothetical protein SAMN05444123_11929 [Rhodopseudomonas pseudopalustris]
MADDNGDKQNLRREGQDTETASTTTLLPMLIGGLVLIVIGMVLVMMFT